MNYKLLFYKYLKNEYKKLNNQEFNDDYFSGGKIVLEKIIENLKNSINLDYTINNQGDNKNYLIELNYLASELVYVINNNWNDYNYGRFDMINIIIKNLKKIIEMELQ